MIQFKCACCGQLLQLGDEWAGKVAKCPYSGQFMQVPQISAAAVQAPPAPPQRAAQPAGREIHNPFGTAPYVAPPKAAKQRSGGAAGAEFNQMASTVASDAEQGAANRAVRASWQRRGTLFGLAGGAALGLVLGVIFGATGAGPGKGESLLAIISVLCGATVLGGGVGGLIGPVVLLARPGVKKLSNPGAIRGALYGTARVASMGALGGLAIGLLRGAFNLMAESNVGYAVQGTIHTGLLMAMAWAAVGAFLGAVFGGVLGALGGYDS